MSNWSESYHLRSDDQADGVNLLQRAGLSGYVYPPANDWVTLFAEGAPFNLNRELVKANEGALLYLCFAEDGGWGFALASGPRVVSAYACRWENGVSVSAGKLRLGALCGEFAALGLPGDLRASLEPLLLSVTEENLFSFSAEDPAPQRHEFAALLGVTNYEYLTYDSLVEEADEEELAGEGVVSVEGNRKRPRAPAGPRFPPFLRLFRAEEEPERAAMHKPQAPAVTFLFPRILHGDAATVKRAWKKVVKQAWKAGSWGDLLTGLEMVPFHELPRPVCVGWLHGPARLHTGDAVWRMYRVGETLKDVALDDRDAPDVEKMERLDTLMLAGAEHFWFILGLLENSCGSFNLGHWPRRRSEEDVHRDYPRAFVRWLPELLKIRDRLGNNTFGDVNVPPMDWSFNIQVTVQLAGLGALEGVVTDVRDLAHAPVRLVHALLREGIIEPDGDRYRLRGDAGPTAGT
jgi:hypothetical protein